MLSATFFSPVRLQWSDVRTYFFVFLFVTGGLVLPQLCHLIPSGGQVLLPIYFFTLIAAYKFGIRVGLITALLSPLANCILFDMPPLAVLPAILIKSTLLAMIAAYIAGNTRKLSIFHLLVVVVGYQFIGSLIEWGMTRSFASATADLTLGIPGMCLEVIGGWLILRKLAAYGQ